MMKNRENYPRISAVELKFIEFCHNKILVLAGITLFLISLIMRWYFRGFISRDYEASLLPWYNELKAGGGYPALKNGIGDYYIPFMYLVSGLPAVFAGRGILDVYGIYFRQITSYNNLNQEGTIDEKNISY